MSVATLTPQRSINDMKKAVFLVIVLVFCIISLHAQSGKWTGITLTGEDEPLLEGTTWLFLSEFDSQTYTYEFRSGGRLVLKMKDRGLPDITQIHTWGREGNTVKIKNSNGHWFSEGKYYPQTQRLMMLTERSNGAINDETWVLYEGSPVASAPVQSSSTNNSYVQPSAPAQSTQTQQPNRNVGKEIADAFRSPLQSGTYSLAGTQEKISIAAIAKSGIISQTWQGKTYQGTYNIDGSRMTIQIRGYTFVFNITSETSFSGHGETWVRTGY
jgi:hypothetical protein